MEESKPKEKASVWSIIIAVLLTLLILFLVFIAYGTAVPNRFYKLLIVTSGSMSPTFEAGDLIMIVKIDPDEVKVGDISTFQTREGELLTHRIVEIKQDGEIVTKGDANEDVDTWSGGWKLGQVETRYITKFPLCGRIISTIKGWFVKDTGAWLKDTEELEADMSAGEWETEPPVESMALPPVTAPTEAPGPTETPEPTETPPPTETPGPTEASPPTEEP